MKERPILFSGPMVQAILEGRKTQTRRVVVAPEKYSQIRECAFCCPHGNAGDELWVRETWATQQRLDHLSPSSLLHGPIFYPADDTWVHWAGHAPTSSVPGKNRPNIFLPRWASRIALEIVSVRVERIQEITAKDIIAEGAVNRPHMDEHLGKCPVSQFDGVCYPDLRSLWGHGWNSINQKRGYGWEKNPWVWVIDFDRSLPAPSPLHRG